MRKRMKIVIIAVTIVMALVFCTGCNKSDAKMQDQYESELIALGFENPEVNEYMYDDYKLVSYTVYFDSHSIDLTRGSDGVWFYYPFVTEEMDKYNLPRENGVKFVGWVGGSRYTPAIELYTANQSAAYFRNWPVSRFDNVGGAYYHFYKQEDGSYNLAVEVEWDDPYWIPNISIKKLQEIASEKFKDDPHGILSSDPIDRILCWVWDFEHGRLKEI